MYLHGPEGTPELSVWMDYTALGSGKKHTETREKNISVTVLFVFVIC